MNMNRSYHGVHLVTMCTVCTVPVCTGCTVHTAPCSAPARSWCPPVGPRTPHTQWYNSITHTHDNSRYRDIWWRGDQWSVSWGVVTTSDSASRIHRLCERYGYRKYENFTIEEQLINTSTTQTANLVNVGIREQFKRPSSIVCELNKGSFCCPLWGEWQIPLGFCSAARHIYLSVRTSAKL